MTSGQQALFAAQLARLGAELRARLQPGLLCRDAGLGPALHLLKGAALMAGESTLASRCHDAESALAVDDEPSLRRHVDRLLTTIETRAQAMRALSLDDLRLALRSGFLSLRRQAGSTAILHLDIDAGWLVRADLLLDVLPLLLANALAHGDEPASRRLAAGKPASLQVTVRARMRDGLPLALLVLDDGRGGRRPREADAPADLLSGRGWGVAAVRARVAALPGARLRYRASPGRGSVVRITMRPVPSPPGC